VRYLELAGDTATSAFANDEAIASYQEAIAVAADMADAAAGTDAGVRLRAKLANVLWRTGRRDETRAAFREALRLADTLPGADAPRSAGWLRKAHLLTRLGRLELADGQLAASAEALEKAAALLGDQPGADWTDAEADQWLEMMIDGRSDLCMQFGDADGALTILEAARPVLEARGNPFRHYSFYMQRASQQMLRDRRRPGEQALADVRRSLEAARRSRDTKDIGYATHFLGWILWLHRDWDEALELEHAALEIAGRVGEAMLHADVLAILAMIAIGRHDAQAVRDLVPRAVAAAQSHGGDSPALARAPLAWLAWQDGNPEGVLAIAAEIEPAAAITQCAFAGTSYRWVYLFPVIAVHLSRTDTERAVSCARPLLDSGQHALPQELNAAVAAACRAWDDGRGDEAAASLRAALDLARDTGFF
jgi:tetratricopeptide (TPR) repeat protein